ncbi:Interferon-induced GTP-binding protein Mx3, putative [Perkinsus marinus ATCC 50983]|uniref:Interferon-induced GTP-binding protein Mx3, putative n=1 Tax=Perkinsus marinus (strain ATCC 50983 / TXsc) TaxID=423536 RepID=C5LA01_PERM5|nr:Interferon-induced GTP-binding protein Mx3, putative [Perkinsus marinus ATCC 50983]EER06257.1 Interferon-induced GTP-binding protein Mx3, putative [Perkinsus marinus ATCC 50983]|eukprot:XP_002774441.1 Interferon-induced GTP-binding protein Mx3, putative [Perkinsus marinus ATCC 50983]
MPSDTPQDGRSKPQLARSFSIIQGHNEQRSELLDVLSDVKTKVQDRLGIVDFPLPQFILIGKQSVGKSRLIEALAGEQFNFVSGTMGSRRPTVLEFRNVQQNKSSRWYIMDKKTNKWQEHPLYEVTQIIGEAHESLGATVTDDPVYVRVESPFCVDMQIVDLPGFRDFALDKEKQQLADQIDNLVQRFMQDTRNVMICVEEAGDAANLSTLSRCKRLDPGFQRTILIRNKLDKYYRDLTAQNVNDWLNGFGDLPDNLSKFCMTLPHWKDKEECPKPFAELREDMNKQDVAQLRFVRSDAGRLTLEDELIAFAAYEEGEGADFMMLPSEDFASLNDYIDYLRNDIKVPAFDVEINGGAQFRRLMYEVEVFLRFSEIGVETKKKDVIQARAERIKWFFISQKDAVVNFMLSIKGSADEQMFSLLYTKHVKLMLENEMIKQLVYKTYDDACARQLEQFMELFDNTLASTFSNPWVFLKRGSSGLENLENDDRADDDDSSLRSSKQNDSDSTDDGFDDMQLPTFEDTKKRIPMEIESRSGIETTLSHWLGRIPMEPQQIDEAVEKVQMLVLKTFSFIRSQISDQIELFAESFFKLPMMRRLEDDMSNIQMTNVDTETYRVRREYLEGEFKTIEKTLASLNECIDKLQGFALKAQAKMSRVAGSK